MQRSLHRTSLLALALGLAVAAAADDTSTESCELCSFPSGWYLDTDFGVAFVSDDSFRFGDYTGTTDDGLYLLGRIAADYWSASGAHWRFAGSDMGLDARRLELRGDLPGRYELRIGYSALPHNLFESGRTPFRLSGDSLTLPPDWQTAPTTTAMGTLNASLLPVEIRTEREAFALGLAFTQNKYVEYTVDYRYTDKSGTGIFGGSFLNTSTLLPRPVDHRFHTLDARMSVRSDSWSAQLGYLASIFRNEDQRLRWDNPFTPVQLGAGVGQAALEPDNEFHRVALSGHYRPAAATQLTANVSLGRMTQDDLLLPYTTSTDLQSPLPVQALDAEVDTFNADVRLVSRWGRALRFRASYTLDDRDNQTPLFEWSYRLAETLAATPRTNTPYDIERRRLRVAADYRLPLRAKLSAGWNRETVQRNFSEVEQSDEDKLWAKLKLPIGQRVDVTAEYTMAERDNNGYRLPDDLSNDTSGAVVSGQNPLLRKYNLADRERRGLEVGVFLRPHDIIDLGLTAERSDDDYTDSVLGLLSADYESIYADMTFAFRKGAALALHGGYEKYSSLQAGSQSFAAPDWLADSEDETRYAGLSLDAGEVFERVRLHLGYTFSDTIAAVQTRASGNADAFPDLSTRLHRFEIGLDYAWRETVVVRLGLLFEDYTVDDWPLDNLEVDSVPRMLGLGHEWLDHDAGIVMLSFRYRNRL